MAQIPQHEIERIKQSISLVALLQQQGFELKKHGKDYVTRCPFHDDKTPSLVISPDKNLWHCLGACNTGGSVIDWMMQLEKIGFRKAVEMLMEQQGRVASIEPREKKVSDPQTNIDHQALLNRVIDHYHQQLQSHSAARQYLANRGLDNDELINQFKLGFSDRKVGLESILSSRPSKVGKAERQALKDIGIKLDSGVERFGGSIVIPIINQNKIQEVYGRKINDGLKKGTAKHLYLPGSHAGVWNLEGLQNQSEIILCESLIDAMTLWVNGFKNVTASYGVNGFTDELLTVLHTENIESVLIAYDRDEAGDKAASGLIEKLKAEGIGAARVKLPPGLDINEWACQSENFTEAFKECLLVASSSFMSTDGRYSGMPGGSTPVATETEVVEKKSEPEVKKQSAGIEVQTNGSDILVELGNRHYRVRGLEKNKSHEQLKINLMVMCRDGRYADAPGGSVSAKKSDTFFIDALDLYQAKPRNQFIKQASIECGLEERVIKSDLGKILLKLEAIQEEQCKTTSDENMVELSEEETEQALALLQDKNLLSRILEDFNQCGVVGEETNKLVGYLGCVSRKLDKPLAIIIQSSSAAGKSSLMDAVLNMMPAEERTQYSAMTGQSLYYLGETNLKNKILAITEEEGAAQASYALKLLQSEGEINIASTGKNAATGDLETQTYHVEGPVMLFLTTTAIDIDEELLNRCLVLTVNESDQQTAAIQQIQRENQTLDGLIKSEHRKTLLTLHQNAQRLLRPLKVVNPYAEHLTFRSDKTRTRRDHVKYLTLIQSIALLHQYQRDIKTVKHDGNLIEYVEVQLEDIELANQLSHEVLGKTLDELPPQTRKLLKQITSYVQKTIKKNKLDQKDFRFSRRDIRLAIGWSDSQLKTHCGRLEEMEYLLVHRGGRGQLMEYELLYDGELEAQPHLMGLIDLDELNKKQHLELSKSGQNKQKSAPSLGQVCPKSGVSLTRKNGRKAKCDKTLDLLADDDRLKSIPVFKNENRPSVSTGH